MTSTKNISAQVAQLERIVKTITRYEIKKKITHKSADKVTKKHEFYFIIGEVWMKGVGRSSLEE